MMSLVSKGGRGVVTAVAHMIGDRRPAEPLRASRCSARSSSARIFGNANPQYDIPRLLDLYMDGKLKLDELVTTEYTLDDINQGYQDMRDGKNIRGLIRYE